MQHGVKNGIKVKSVSLCFFICMVSDSNSFRSNRFNNMVNIHDENILPNLLKRKSDRLT